MGLNMREKQAVTREYKPHYKQASKKEKKALLDEFIKLTGYHRKSAIRLLCAKQMKQAIIYQKGKAVKIKPVKKDLQTERVNESILMKSYIAYAFFGRFSGSSAEKILAPLMRQQMSHITEWKAFGITMEIAEKLKRISPAAIDRYLKKTRNQ